MMQSVRFCLVKEPEEFWTDGIKLGKTQDDKSEAEHYDNGTTEHYEYRTPISITLFCSSTRTFLRTNRQQI